MRRIVSPLGGISSPFGRKLGADVGAAGLALLGDTETKGLALDFLANSYANRNSNGAELLIFSETAGFALDFTDNSYVVKY